MAGIELPDWLRALVLAGKYGSNYLPVAVDAAGQLYIVLTGAPDVTIPGNVNVNDLNTLKQIQGSDGAVYRTAKVDANGQFIMVPRGASGNYLAVDASGFMSAILKGLGADAALHTIAADNNGQLIMVPRGSTGNYMNVDASGFLSAKMVALGQDLLQHQITADSSGQIIMVPRGQSGNYMNVDASGFLTTILKGLGASGLQTVAVDTSGRMIGLLANVSDAWGSASLEGLQNLASALGSPQRWDNRGRVFDAITFDTGIPNELFITKHGNELYSLVPSIGEHGDYSLKCTMENVAGSYITLNKYYRTSPLGKHGLELSFSVPSTNYRIKLYIDTTTATDFRRMWVEWYLDTSTLYLHSSTGGTVTLSASMQVSSDVRMFQHIKMVADLSTEFWTRVLANEAKFSPTTYDIIHVAGGGVPSTFVSIQFLATTPMAETFYVDDFVVTVDEPA